MQENTPSQRDLAADLHVSLGKLNSLLNDLIAQGLVCSPEKNVSITGKRMYTLTDTGIEKRKKLAEDCIERKEQEMSDLKKDLLQLGLDLEEMQSEYKQ